MRSIQLGTSGLRVPTVAVGCMRINRLTPAEAETFVRTALDLGANFFDHSRYLWRGRVRIHLCKSRRHVAGRARNHDIAV